MLSASIIAINRKKEASVMKTREGAKKGLYIGAGAGLVLFAIIGFLPGSFVGGVIGLKIAGTILGSPVEASLLPRFIVGASMLLGILVSGLILIIGTSLLGWAAGYVLDAAGYKKTEGSEVAPHS